ncbi:MAG: hypothetical protein V3U54_13295 [Thermodesulfobacteriota bacterium]
MSQTEKQKWKDFSELTPGHKEFLKRHPMWDVYVTLADDDSDDTLEIFYMELQDF